MALRMRDVRCGPDAADITFATAGYVCQRYLGTATGSTMDFTHIIVDEVHERHLDGEWPDFLLPTMFKTHSHSHSTLVSLASITVFFILSIVASGFPLGSSEADPASASDSQGRDDERHT